MSPRARHVGAQGDERPTVSIALPTEIHQHHHEAAPALVSPDVNPAHVGLTRNALADVLRAMRADATFADRVIVLSRKRVAAAPEDVIAFMRERYTATSTSTAPKAAPAKVAPAKVAADDDDGIDHALLARAGRRLKPRARGAVQ